MMIDEAVALQLEVLTAGIVPPPRVLLKGRRASLGRGERCDVRVPDPSVSTLHASIVKRGANYLLIDEHSKYGTGVSNGTEPVWLAADSPRILQEGEHIWLGQIELKVSLVAPSRGQQTGLEELPYTLVKAGLTTVGLDPTDVLVHKTLRELTDLADEEVPLQTHEQPSTPLRGVADLFDEDKHPPWKTDVFVGLLALLITLGCFLLYWNMDQISH